MTILLSILIPSIPEKLTYLARTISELERQSYQLPVEILATIDNKKRSTGFKRNMLIQQAQGKYVSFVDDDDRIELDYIKTLINTINQNPSADCITFNVEINSSGIEKKITKFDMNFLHSEDDEYYYRKPNHIMCYSKDIVIKEPFQDLTYGEDTEWAERASKLIKNQINIPRTLYYYDNIMKRPKNNPGLLNWENRLMQNAINNSLENKS